jgi:rRNA pseudouridine-1189 N-methylase Emg1 (Nep1/Mra1 family)
MKSLQEQESLAAFIGAFPHGHFSEETKKLADMSVSIDPMPLEAWTITSRVIYEFERVRGLPEKRWGKQLL